MGGVDDRSRLCPVPLLAPRPRPQPRLRPKCFDDFFFFMHVCGLKGLNLVEESLHLGLPCGVGLIGRCEFGCMLGGSGCAFVLVDLDVPHHLIYNGVGVVEAHFVNSSAVFPELKVSLSEVVSEVIPYFVRQIGAFPRLDVVFENSLFVEDN